MIVYFIIFVPHLSLCVFAHVDWLVGLLVANSASGVSELDERTELILDILSRHAYANMQSKPTRSFAAEKLMEDALTRAWVHNSSVISIAVGRAGWTEVTIRRPTGTVAYLTRIENKYALLSFLVNVVLFISFLLTFCCL